MQNASMYCDCRKSWMVGEDVILEDAVSDQLVREITVFTARGSCCVFYRRSVFTLNVWIR